MPKLYTFQQTLEMLQEIPLGEEKRIESAKRKHTKMRFSAWPKMTMMCFLPLCTIFFMLTFFSRDIELIQSVLKYEIPFQKLHLDIHMNRSLTEMEYANEADVVFNNFTVSPTPYFTEVPSPRPTEIPSPISSAVPTPHPTTAPSPLLTLVPSVTPTEAPTEVPSALPTGVPSTGVPTSQPSQHPTSKPSYRSTITNYDNNQSVEFKTIEYVAIVLSCALAFAVLIFLVSSYLAYIKRRRKMSNSAAMAYGVVRPDPDDRSEKPWYTEYWDDVTGDHVIDFNSAPQTNIMHIPRDAMGTRLT